MAATQRLLLKRARSMVEQPELSDLRELTRQLRTAFPEYQRQPMQEFSKRLGELLFPDGFSERKEPDCTESVSRSTDADDHEVIDDAISEFIASEKTDVVNKSLRNLYSTDPNSITQRDSKPPSQKSDETPNRAHKKQKVEKKPGKKSQVKERQGKKSRTGKNVGPRAVSASITQSFMTVPRKLSYGDLGGLEDVIRDIKELVEYPLKHPEVYEWLGVDTPKGILLHGPPGCGKTALAHAIAYECNVPFLRVSGPEIVSGMSGESENKIRTLFSEAAGCAPSIVFVDEIDAIAAKRETAQREMERRIVAQMLTCMDDLSTSRRAPIASDSTAANELKAGEKVNNGDVMRRHVVVLGATNRPDVLDPALRRAGRFDREISLGIPTEASRVKILNVLCTKLRLEGDFDFSFIARKTPGFVGADLEALTREAATVAIGRIFQTLQGYETQPPVAGRDGDIMRFGGGRLSNDELEKLRITMDDFTAALSKVQPSLGREGFATKPDITWSDVGSLSTIREELSFSICQPILHPEIFERMGLSLASGVLLFGPPGCGKTLVAKAVANEAGTNFISIKGPELLNKYVGESERAVRQLFTRARAAKPCVLFFDEMDALAPKRGTDNNQAAERLVNQLLTEMDGIDGRQGVYLIAATNRADIIDPALLRPGRLDKILYVPLPDADGRVSILQTISKKSPISPEVDFCLIGRDAKCEGFSGADLAALLREACVLALKVNVIR